MKRILILIFLVTGWEAHSQNFYRYRFEAPWSVSASVGATQYYGELYSFWKYNEGIQPEWNANLSVSYLFGTNLRARLDGTYYKISGSDLPSDPRAERIPRNLHFKASNFELSGMIEYYLFPVKTYNITRPQWNPYIFAGVGISTNNPRAKLDGNWVDLRPLQLENNPYDEIIAVFPMGIGLRYKLNVYMDLKVEGNYRFTLTDYLDDISAYNVEEFYLDLVDDYVSGTNPDRLRLAIRNPRYYVGGDAENGEPNVDAILRSNGSIRRGSGLDERYDGYMSLNVGVSIHLTPDIWDNWIFRKRSNNNWFRFW
jgi:hypothetical protein